VNFYKTANASRSTVLPGGKKRITFDVYSFFAGAWLGVVATEDPDAILGLDELSLNPKTGIERITEEEYKKALQKKTPPPNSPRLVASPSVPPQAAIIADRAGRLAAKAAEQAPAPAAAPAPELEPRVYESIDEVVKIGEVKAGPGSPPVPKAKSHKYKAKDKVREFRKRAVDESGGVAKMNPAQPKGMKG